jgi:hypothetical protein
VGGRTPAHLTHVNSIEAVGTSADKGRLLHARSPGAQGQVPAHTIRRPPCTPDIAVVVLDQPVTSVTPARLASLRELDQMHAAGALNQSTKFTAVGYGDYAQVPR